MSDRNEWKDQTEGGKGGLRDRYNLTDVENFRGKKENKSGNTIK